MNSVGFIAILAELSRLGTVAIVVAVPVVFIGIAGYIKGPGRDGGAE